MADALVIDTEAGPALAGAEDRGILRFLTCGSVDDGKSTLIGRLLFDTKRLFEDQLACADLVLLNKTDLVAVDRLAVLEQELAQEIRPGVRILRTARGEIDPAILFGLGAGVEDGIDARPSHHDDGEDHDHDDFESFIVDLGELSGPEPLLAALAESIAVHDILRVKGFLDVVDKDMRLVLQGVGNRVQHYYDRAWERNERSGRLVVIGLKGLDRAAITRDLAL